MSELELYIKTYFGIGQDELSVIASLFQPQSLLKGDFYAREGAYCNKLSFIRDGLVRVYATHHDKEVTQWIGTKGYFITDLSSLLFQTPSRWTIQTLSDTTLYTIDRENYQRIALLAPKWHELEKLFIAKCFTILEDRIFSQLSMSAEERYIQLMEQQADLIQQAPMQYLASMLGMTPETLSRIRRKYAHK